MGATDTPDLVEQDKPLAGQGDASLRRRMEQLPEGHPASPRYSRDSGTSEPGDSADRVRPLTDAEYAEHVAEVEQRLDEARAAGLTTDRLYTIDLQRKVWSDERDALHDQLVADLYARAADVPCEGRAILAGGLPGSGKTTLLTGVAGVDLSHYLMINPDSIKEEMARRGLIPKVEGLSAMEASDLVHEECSWIAKRLAHRAHSDAKNLIWDITMSSESSTLERITDLREAGYSHVEGIFVDIPVEVSVRRADGRYREGLEDHRNHEGLGGRIVPAQVIRDHADADWGSQNRRVFESLKPRLDAWAIYDNSADGRQPVLVETGYGGAEEQRG